MSYRAFQLTNGIQNIDLAPLAFRNRLRALLIGNYQRLFYSPLPSDLAIYFLFIALCSFHGNYFRITLLTIHFSVITVSYLRIYIIA